MKPFEFLEPTTVQEATTLLQAGGARARLMAGGSDLLGELKEGIAHYPQLVSLARIDALRTLRQSGDGLMLGSTVTLATLEHEPLLIGPWRILAEAARGIATPEIRNQGTLGGNLCQRPRCLHYRSAAIPCLKKNGTDCPAVHSPYQQNLAVFGSRVCHAVHASDLALPLLLLDAVLYINGPTGERELPLWEFFPPSTQASVQTRVMENTLAADEVVTHVFLPTQHPDWRGTTLKGRERTAGDFPLVSVAFGCRMENGRMHDVRLMLGAVAATPWPCPDVEELLEGQALSPELAREAAELAFANATPLPHNGFKVPWGRSLVARAIEAVAQ